MTIIFRLTASLLLAVLCIISLAVGSHSIGFADLWSNPLSADILEISRIPRTVSLLLCGMALSVTGLIMQMLTQNRFVEPATAGSMQAAALGMLIITIIWPAAPVIIKMGIATVAALLGTALFLLILSRLSLHASLIVPLVGLMLGAVISAITTFIAVQFDLMQSLSAWNSGDFSGILRGRYELLWLVGLVSLGVFVLADRFAVAGMGKDFAVNLGLDYRKTILLGMLAVAIVSGIVVSVVGMLPFLGLIVPNIVRLIRGDNVRSNLPWIAFGGGALILLCDIVGRVIIYPFELPAGTILGVLGAIVFLCILIRDNHLLSSNSVSK